MGGCGVSVVFEVGLILLTYKEWPEFEDEAQTATLQKEDGDCEERCPESAAVAADREEVKLDVHSPTAGLFQGRPHDHTNVAEQL